MEYEFQAQIPVEHVLHLVGIVRNNMSNLIAAKGDILEEIGAITGELGAYFNSQEMPYGTALANGAFQTMQLDQLCDKIEAELAPESASAVGAIDIMTIMMIIRLVIQLLNSL